MEIYLSVASSSGLDKWITSKFKIILESVNCFMIKKHYYFMLKCFPIHDTTRQSGAGTSAGLMHSSDLAELRECRGKTSDSKTPVTKSDYTDFTP